MGPFAFTKADRLRKRSEYLKVFRHGTTVRNRIFMANILGGGQVRTRLGITVSKKVGNAVVRNRIKRVTREFFRHTKHQISSPRDINVIANRQAGRLENEKLRFFLEDLFNRINRSIED